MSSNEKKYLLKQKGIWFFRMKIPAKYRHIFGVKIYKRTTGEKDLDRARLVRAALLLRIKLQFKEVDTGEKIVLPDKAIQHLKELQTARRVINNPNSSVQEVEGAEEWVDLEHQKVIEEASKLFIPSGTSQEEINKASVGRDGHQYEVEAIKNLDKSGKAMKYIDASLGRTFDAYVEDYYKYKIENGDAVKKCRAHRNAVKALSKSVPINNLKFKYIKEWARDRVLNKGYQPNTVKGELEKCNAYLKYLAEDLEVDWAVIPTPFTIKMKDLPKKDNTGKDRKAWTMEEMKLIYQTVTPQIKNKPELKDLMALGMIYGARIEEFCQLTVGHIKHEENLRCIFIDKSKTDAYHKFGQRYLPIVDCLKPIIDKLVEDKQPEDYLITTDSSPNQSRSALIGGSFLRHVEGLGYNRPKILNYGGEEQTTNDFHSFRKTVNTNLTLLQLTTNQRNSICGWGTAFKSKSMADTAYLENKIAYPLVERKKHIEKCARQFTFSF